MENAGPTVPAAPAGSAGLAPERAPGPVWRFLIQPRWLGWHLLMVVSFWGMLWLGDWQLHRALAGNGLSWAYTFEWPIFAICGLFFWVKSLREEIRLKASGPDGEVPPDVPAGTDALAVATASQAHLARLQAEVQGHGKWHGWR